MSKDNIEQVREVVKAFVNEKIEKQGLAPKDTLEDNCDLLLEGLVDSMGILELMTSFDDYFGKEFDFEELDPEKMTIVGPLCEHVANQV